MLWESIAGQDETIGYLKKSIKDGVLTHAYLFSGPKGVGKYTTAKVFAAAMNCKNDACGECLSCRKTREEIHPDVFYIVPEGNFITIGQIRELQREVALKPLEGQLRIVLIDEAEKLNEEAASALLKILEEPPDNLIFVLITDNVDGILPTVASRCQIVRFKQVPVNIVKQLLVDDYGVSYEKAELVARLSEGMFSEALSFIESSNKFTRRLQVLSITERIPYQNLSKLFGDVERLIFEIKKSLEETKAQQRQSLTKLREIAISKTHLARLKKHLEQKNKRELIRMEHQGFDQILSTLASWYRDLLVISYCSCEKLIINIDKIDKLKIVSEVTSASQARQALEVVLETKNLLRSNVNVRLALEVMLLKLQEVF